MIDEKLLDEVILQVFKKRLAAELRNFALYNDNKDVGEIYAMYMDKQEKLQKEIDLAVVCGPTGNRPPPTPPNPATSPKKKFGIRQAVGVGEYSLQIIFESRKRANEFAAEFGIPVVGEHRGTY